VVDVKEEDLEKDIESAKRLLEGKAAARESPNVWRESSKIGKVVSQPRVVVSSFVSTTAGKNWGLHTIDGEEVYVEIGLKEGDMNRARNVVKPFRERLRKIVEAMGETLKLSMSVWLILRPTAIDGGNSFSSMS
jgi:hypothetical protein